MIDKKIDTIILGCTHYPLLKGTIKKVEENKAVGLLPFGLISEKQKNSDINIKGASNIVIDEAKAHIIKEIFHILRK